MRVVYDAAAIAAAIARLAAAIAADHRGQPLLLIGVLKGAMMVVPDLARALADVPDGPSEIAVEYVCAASYGAATTSRASLDLQLDTRAPIAGRYVVVVDDIADGGITLQALRALFQARRPARLRCCSLFERTDRRTVDPHLDYPALPVPGNFVVGYGLDYQEKYRNLPYLAELSPS